MAAARLRRVDRARDREDLAAGLGRQARRDQRSGPQRRLDDQRAARQAGDDAVADRKVLRQRRHADRELADDRCRRQRCDARERAMPRRIDAVEPGADDGDRAGRRPRARPRARRRRCRAPGPRRSTSRLRLRCAAKARAFSRPCGVGLRLPTIAIDGAVQQLEAAPGIEQQRRVGGLQQRLRDSAGRRARARRAARRRRRASQRSAAARRSCEIRRLRGERRRDLAGTTARARRPMRRSPLPANRTRASSARAAVRGRRRASRASAATPTTSSRSIMRSARVAGLWFASCPRARDAGSLRPDRCLSRRNLRLGEAVAGGDRLLDRQDQRVRHAVRRRGTRTGRRDARRAA